MRCSQGSAEVKDGKRPPLLLEPERAPCEVARFLERELDLFRGDYVCDLLQALFTHRLCQDGVSLFEGIDPVDQIDVEVAHIHRKPADTVDQRGAAALVRFGIVFTECGQRHRCEQLIGRLNAISRTVAIIARDIVSVDNRR